MQNVTTFPNKIETIVHQLGLQIKKGKLQPDSDSIHNYLKKWYPSREYGEREEIIEKLSETDLNIVRKFYPMSKLKVYLVSISLLIF